MDVALVGPMPEFKVGGRYLVTAAGSTVNACGYTLDYDAATAERGQQPSAQLIRFSLREHRGPVRRRGLGIPGQDRAAKNARRSSTSRSGASIAGKCPPAACWFQ